MLVRPRDGPGPFEIVERIGPETFNIRRPRGKLVKYHISQLKRATTAIHQQAEDDEIPAANDPPDDPDPPQRRRGRPRKPIPTPRANTIPDKTTRSEEGENLNQDETPSPSAVPRRRRGRPRKDDAEYQNHQMRTCAAPKEGGFDHTPKRKTIGLDRAAENSSSERR
jgi:type IV secretory pathway VirB10-like protein